MQSAGPIDVFISYTGSDWNWASWLDFVVREAGYTTVVQGYDFALGKGFVAVMDEALRQCRFVACVLSPGYLESEWCAKGWQTVLDKDKAKKRLLLLRVADCKPRGLLKARAYLDLVGIPEEIAQDRILAALKQRDGQDPRSPAKPALQGMASPSHPTSHRPRFPGSLPPIWNITEERNPHFTGRDEMLEQLHRALTEGTSAAQTQAIMGLGGVGKTQLVLEYAYRYASDYDVVWWLRAEQLVTLAHDYAELAPHLGVAVVTDQGQMVRDACKALEHRERVLLIFDNATGPDPIKPYMPAGSERRIIVTTRAQNWPGSASQDVNALSLQAAIEFLLKRTGRKDQAGAKDVAQRLGCLPLALEQAAAYVEACKTTLRGYAALLKRHGLELLEEGRPSQCQQTVGASCALAFEKLQVECPPAADLLNLCAFLAPDTIYVGDLASSAIAHLPERLAKALADERAFNQAKSALLRYSLFRTDQDMGAISIHCLVQEVTRLRLEPEARDRWLVAALRAINAVFPFDSGDVRTWPTCSRWLAHAFTLVNSDKVDVLEPHAYARLVSLAGIHLQSRANYAEAEPLLRRALAIGEASFGPKHSRVAVCLSNLAALLRDTNRLAEAEPLILRALAIGEASLGPSHPKVAVFLNVRASLLRATNRLAEAEPLYRRVLAIDEANLGPNHAEVATDLHSLASLLRSTNRVAEAEPLYRRALATSEASLGPNHSTVATRLNNLASLLRSTKRLAEAEPLYRRALAIDETSLGPNHPNVARDLNNLAWLLQNTNRVAEAEPMYQRALAIAEGSLGVEHPATAMFRKNLNSLLAQRAKELG